MLYYINITQRHMRACVLLSVFVHVITYYLCIVFYLVRLQRNIADQILYFNQIVQKWQLCTEQFRHVCFSRYRRTCSVLSPRVQRQVAARSICCFVPCKLIWARISNSRYLELALQKMSRTPCLLRLFAKEIENPQI